MSAHTRQWKPTGWANCQKSRRDCRNASWVIWPNSLMWGWSLAEAQGKSTCKSLSTRICYFPIFNVLLFEDAAKSKVLQLGRCMLGSGSLCKISLGGEQWMPSDPMCFRLCHPCLCWNALFWRNKHPLLFEPCLHLKHAILQLLDHLDPLHVFQTLSKMHKWSRNRLKRYRSKGQAIEPQNSWRKRECPRWHPPAL